MCIRDRYTCVHGVYLCKCAGTACWLDQGQHTATRDRRRKDKRQDRGRPLSSDLPTNNLRPKDHYLIRTTFILLPGLKNLYDHPHASPLHHANPTGPPQHVTLSGDHHLPLLLPLTYAVSYTHLDVYKRQVASNALVLNRSQWSNSLISCYN